MTQSPDTGEDGFRRDRRQHAGVPAHLDDDARTVRCPRSAGRGPLTASELASRVGAGADALSGGLCVARDTPLTDVLPWRVLEFQRM